MNIDTSMLIDYLVPDSISDFGAIFLWVLIVVLLILLYVDISTYLYYHRNTSNRTEKKQQTMSTPLQMKQYSDENIQTLDDIRKKVDALLEVKNL